jgi:hypothetical protein
VTDKTTRANPRERSAEVTEGIERAPARSMLRAIGFTDEDFTKPQVGVVSSWNTVTPCNATLDRDARWATEGVRSAGGVPLGEVMSFVSGLYFRGKLAYAETFGIPLVITADAGLRPADTPVTVGMLRASARVDIDAANPRYRRPLEQSARTVASLLKPDDTITLLGSIASDKYVGVLLGIFGERLTFPIDFVGRGDMSRGGLLLRCVRAGRELDYVPVAGAIRHGARPPRLERSR